MKNGRIAVLVIILVVLAVMAFAWWLMNSIIANFESSAMAPLLTIVNVQDLLDIKPPI